MRAALFLLLATAAPVAAQEPGSRPTREFVQAAAQSDQFEILEGQTAMTQSRDPQIRAFAAKLIEDHQATRRALTDAATRAGLKPPAPGMSGDQAMMLSALQSQNGRDFDRTFATQQVIAHRGALTVQQQYAASGDASAVREAAAAASRLIEGHLAMAERLKAQFAGQ